MPGCRSMLFSSTTPYAVRALLVYAALRPACVCAPNTLVVGCMWFDCMTHACWFQHALHCYDTICDGVAVLGTPLH